MAILSEKQLHQLVAMGAAAAAGIAARAVVHAAWDRVRPDSTPENPAVDEGWGDALAFAAVSGMLVAVARIAAQRAATSGVHYYLGHDPYGVDVR